MSSSEPPPEPVTEGRAEEFQLSQRWVVVGLLAIVIGMGCGWIMSSATFLK